MNPTPLSAPAVAAAAGSANLELRQGVVRMAVERIDGATSRQADDLLAVEEPLEIRLLYYDDELPVQKSISITMRTPGHDAELAAGFLFGEGIVKSRASIASVRPWGPAEGILRVQNVVRVELASTVDVDLQRLQRHFYTTSSCGVCGKASLAALAVAGALPVAAGRPIISAEMLHQLPAALRKSQDVFAQTGGLHAAALFDAEEPPAEKGTVPFSFADSGKGDSPRRFSLVAVREDVGRHNAVDKLVGSQLLAERLPLSQSVLLVSGRASFELAQKAVMAGIPIMAAVGAPSSLAVETAVHFGMTLIGFLRDNRFNVYCGAERIGGLK